MEVHLFYGCLFGQHLDLGEFAVGEGFVGGVLELKRLRGFLETGESGFWSSFPFDPLGLRSDANRVAEVKHGRLGMLAMAGIAAQAVVYRAGPLVALRDHVEDPFGCNLASNVAHIGQTFEAIASKM